MARNGLHAKALQLYAKMGEMGVKPDRYTFPSVINACGNLMDLKAGRDVHEDVVRSGFDSDIFVANALIDMYSRCNELERAGEVFDEMPQRDVVSWNSLISGFTANGCFEEALDIYHRLRLNGLMPDSFTFSSVLLACGGLREVEEGEMIHGMVTKVGACRYVVVSNGLLSMYLKFDMVDSCGMVFNEMVCRDNVTLNTMICGYCALGLFRECIGLFREMADRFEPDMLTITTVLRGCTYIGDLTSGRFVHDYMVSNGYPCDTIASNILVNMYAKCGDLVRSREVYENTASQDLVSCNTLLQGYVESMLYPEAIELFERMRVNFHPDYITYVTLLSLCTELANVSFTEELHCDVIKRGFKHTQIVGNALMDAYAKCGKMEDSVKQFEYMKTRDVVTWNSIIASCGHPENGLKMLSRMREEGMVPDVPTFLSALPLCSYLAAKRQGKELHGCILRLGFEFTTSIANALIEMYSYTGSLRNSILVFEQMKIRDLVSWTAIISSYGMYGEGMQALQAFHHMKLAGIVPDHIVFIAIMRACSHSGLVEEGQACFQEMKKVYNLELRIEHYACVVDLLSRSGHLAEAEEFILSMPLKPDVSIWGMLLSACRAKGDMNIADRASKQVLLLNVNNPGYHVLASNIYASMGKWDQSTKIRSLLMDKGLRKDPGCSWVET